LAGLRSRLVLSAGSVGRSFEHAVIGTMIAPASRVAAIVLSGGFIFSLLG
jgi:hypothetical protein